MKVLKATKKCVGHMYELGSRRDLRDRSKTRHLSASGRTECCCVLGWATHVHEVIKPERISRIIELMDFQHKVVQETNSKTPFNELLSFSVNKVSSKGGD